MSQPVYNYWISSKDTPFSRSDQYLLSNNTILVNTRFPLFPTNRLCKIKLTSFQINAAPAGFGRGGIPWTNDDPAPVGDATSVGVLIVNPNYSDDEPPPTPAFRNLSSVNMMVNWLEQDKLVLGTFNADDGSNLQSEWSVISAPLPNGNLEIALHTSSPLSLLGNRDVATGVMTDVSDWVACISFAALDPQEVKAYYADGRVPQHDLVANYPDTWPTAEEGRRTIASHVADPTVETDLTECYLKLYKPNFAWMSYQVSVEINNTTASPVNVALDVFPNITDSDALTATLAFATQTKMYTTAPVAVAPVAWVQKVTFTFPANDQGLPAIFVQLVNADTGLVTFPAGVKIIATPTPAPAYGNGATDGDRADLNYDYVGTPF